MALKTAISFALTRRGPCSHKSHSTNLRHNFEVSVECADGWEGNPEATVCDGDGKAFTIDA